MNIIEANLHISVKDMVVIANIRPSQIFIDEKPCCSCWNTKRPRPWDPLELLCIDSWSSLLFRRQWWSDEGEKNECTIWVKKKIKIYFKLGLTIINNLEHITTRFKPCLHLSHCIFNKLSFDEPSQIIQLLLHNPGWIGFQPGNNLHRIMHI